MKPGVRSDQLRLKDILLAIDALDRHRNADRARFDTDELLQCFVLRQVEVIGEAASKLTAELRSAHPEVPWASIVNMRNRLIHDYSKVDLETVWRVFQHDSKPLGGQVRKILGKLAPHD